MLESMIENAVLSIESIKEYYLSQIDIINDNIEKEGEKYCIGVVIDNYLHAKMKEHLKFLDKVPEEMEKMGSSLVEEVNLIETEDTISCKYKIIDNDKFLKLGFELDPKKATKEFHKLQQRRDWYCNSTLILLIIKFEEAIANFFNYLILNFPNAYLSNKTLTYSEILEINLEDFKKILAKKEVEELMRQSISEWYTMFKQKHGINTEPFINYYKEFIELYYRRNIIVHNNSIVNKSYLQGVDEEYRKEISLNQIINANKNYLNRAFDITYIMIYGTFFQAIKQYKDKSIIYDLFFDLGFSHMMNKEWEVSKFIFENLIKVKELNESDKIMSQINYWISVKNGDNFEKIRVEIENCDFSAKETQFKVAKLILLEKFEEALILLVKIFPNEISANSIEVWPLFIQFRLSNEYIEFKNSHKDDFELHEYTQDILNNNESNDLFSDDENSAFEDCVAATLEAEELEAEELEAEELEAEELETEELEAEVLEEVILEEKIDIS